MAGPDNLCPCDSGRPFKECHGQIPNTEDEYSTVPLPLNPMGNLNGLELAGRAARDDIPLPLKRAIRKRCGFGCVICGLPLYEYDHLYGYSPRIGHVESEITLLCDKHHKEKTNRLLPLQDVLAANEAPLNLRSGVSSPYHFHMSGPKCTVQLGDCSFSASLRQRTALVPLAIWGQTIVGFTFDDGHLFLTLQLYVRDRSQPKSADRLVLAVLENELVYCTDLWDVQFVSSALTVHREHRDIALVMRLHPPDRINIERARLQYNGCEVEIGPNGVKNLWSGCVTSNISSTSNQFLNGIIIGKPSQPGPGIIGWDEVW
jgi:hypothetical protein